MEVSDLKMLAPEEIKLMSFEEAEIKVLLKGDSELTFKFQSHEQLRDALKKWCDPAVHEGQSESPWQNSPASPRNEVVEEIQALGNAERPPT